MYLLCSFGFILHEFRTHLRLTSFPILHVLHSSSSSFKTANTLLFTLYQIAINPSIQERLRADIREVVGGDRTIKPEHISKLPLLKNSITEAQRWGWGVKLGHRGGGGYRGKWAKRWGWRWGKLGLTAESMLCCVWLSCQC